MVAPINYEAIVIGGGIGGLAAAAMLAKAGKKTLLVEKETRLGGLTRPAVWGPYEFEVGARLLMGCNSDGPYGPGVIHSFLEFLGVRQQVEFIPVQPIATVQFPDGRFEIRSGRQEFIESLRRVGLPGLEKLEALLELCSRIFSSNMAFSSSGKPWTDWRALTVMPLFIRYALTTAEAVLSKYLPDQRTRTVVGSLWPYLGIPPRQASFLAWTGLMATYIEEGAYFCRGGLHQLADAIGSAFERDGGELRLGCEARRVLVQDRTVTGVELADGQRCTAPAVIATIDPRLVFRDMIDPAESPVGYTRRLGRLKPSDKGLSICFVTDLDLPGMGLSFENLFFDSWDEGQVERHPLNGQAGCIAINIPTLADPGLAPPGRHLVSVFAGLPNDAPMSPENLQRYGEVVRSILLERLPELEGHLLDVGNASVSSTYHTHAFGAIYGWKTTPWQASLGRPGLHTPVRGLILAGQWTRPLQGVMPVILSGCEAARIVLREYDHRIA